MRSEMRRQRGYEMDWKNSWRRKENHSDCRMHRCFGGDWNMAPGWGVWRQCGSSSGTRESTGGCHRGRPWRDDCWRLRGTGTQTGRSRNYCPESQSLVRGLDWIFTKSLEKLREKKNSRRMQWSPSGILYEVAAGKENFTWPEMECIALAALSLCNLLRIGEAWTAHRSGLGQLVFQGEKSRPGVQVQDVGPWAERWLRFLDEERRRRGGNGTVAYNFSSPSE